MKKFTVLTLAALMVVAANYLAKFGDIIAIRTRLGGLFVGTLLLAGATSLPELLTEVDRIADLQDKWQKQGGSRRAGRG